MELSAILAGLVTGMVTCALLTNQCNKLKSADEHAAGYRRLVGPLHPETCHRIAETMNVSSGSARASRRSRKRSFPNGRNVETTTDRSGRSAVREWS